MKSEKVQEMHDKFKVLSADDMMKVIAVIRMGGNVPSDLDKIMKTYLYRALQKEGIR